MKQIIIVILAILTFSSCRQNDRESQIINLVTDISRIPEFKTDLIVYELHLYQDQKVLEHNGQNSIPVVFETYHDRDFFLKLANQNLILKNDIDYMYSQIVHPIDTILDSLTLKLPTISINKIIEMNRKSLSQRSLPGEYIIPFSFIQFSNPLFSKDHKRVIIKATVYKSTIVEKELLLKYENSTWKITKVIDEHNIYRM